MKTFHEIAALAHAGKKPTKKECFAIALKLANGNITLSVNEIATLYSFFFPTITQVKTPFDWATRAVDKKDKRLYLTAVYSDGSRLIGSNGHRLHLLNNTHLPQGFYDNAGNALNLETFGVYPVIDCIIEDGDWNPLNMDACKIVDNVSSREMSELYETPNKKMHYVKKYVDEAMSFGTLSRIIKIENTTSKLKITYIDGIAVIMGYQL